MRLLLNGVDVDCIIGDRPDERVRCQRLTVDAELEITDGAAMSDSLADTVDYAALVERIRATLVAARCRMIERAARLVYEVCRDDPRVRKARVRVEKAGALAHLSSAVAVYPD